MPLIPLAADVREVVDRIAEAKGRACFVGGCVRDALLGRPAKDLDLEVYGLEPGPLLRVLRRCGRVDEVGRSFAVFKLRLGVGVLDVSLPRRDRKAGPGHRGIAVEADPFLDPREASRRRDLTINAIAWEPLEDRIIDPWEGRRDLAARRLRAVDPDSFGEDPLRALRVVQFAARFAFSVDPALERLCAGMPLGELPAERVRGEVEKLLLQGVELPPAWDFACRAGIWRQVLPGWERPCPARLPRVTAALPPTFGPAFSLAFAAACLPGDVEDSLDRLKIFRQGGYDLRRQVVFLVRAAATPELGDAELRAAADEGDLRLLATLADRPDWRARAVQLGVLDGPLPELLQGRDLVALGVPSGPGLGRLLAELRAAQLRGEVADPEAARRWMTTRLGR